MKNNIEIRQLEDILRYKKLLIYGIGSHYKEVYKSLKDKELVLFDGNPLKWGKGIEGKKIHAPEEMKSFMDDETGVVIACIYNQYEIAKNLVGEIGIPEERIFMYTSPWYEENIYKTQLIQENWNRIEEYAQRFADESSRKYYMSSIRARLERNPLKLSPNPKCIIMGEYADMVKLERNDIIIDCGAYTGDTAEMYINRLAGECQIYAIEPYHENYIKMLKRIEANCWQDKIKAYNCAVGGQVSRAVINFNQDDFKMGVNLSNKEGREKQEILIETLDHLLRGRNISYIKMDIEGEEKNALEGARGLIADEHPKLMISAYHKVEDFWELPEKIWSLNSDYKIYVGHAPGVSTEMEFYCIDDK